MTLMHLLVLLGCAPQPHMGSSMTCGLDPANPLPSHTECPDGPTIQGIDVSYWQGTVDWERVADDGVKFAFIRVSHGIEIYDTRYTANWAGARDNGIVRGTYQYFMAGESAVDQANLLLDEMGPLEEGDLPPVLDVESGDNEGIPASTVKAGIQAWIDIVEPAIGRPPLIYTSIGSWDSMTGGWDPGDVPLWVANWGVSCPSVPDQWDDWVFWQYSNVGDVSGISTDVDLDVYNGTEEDLALWADPVEDQTCDSSCPVAAEGETLVEEDSDCGCLSGDPDAFQEADGHDGHSWWVRADVEEPDYAEGLNWMLDFRQAGTYALSAWVPDSSNLTGGALYKVFHGGRDTVVTVDQAAAGEGWVSLGTFDFAAGDGQWVRLGDNYGDAGDADTRVAIDALRIQPYEAPVDTGEPDQDCTCEEGDLEEMLCTDGRVRTRTCQDCAWTSWSPCLGAGRVPEVSGCACGTTPSRSLGPLVLAMVGLGVLVGRRRRTGL